MSETDERTAGEATDAPRVEKFTGVDTAWLRLERPKNLMVINALLRFTEPLEFDELRALLDEKLTPFRRFRQVAHGKDRPVGRPRWHTEDRFDLDAHLHRVALPAPGDEATLQALVGDLCSQPLDDARPLWDASLIEGVGEGNALFMRFHHSLADGFSLLYLMMALADDGQHIQFPRGFVSLPTEDLDEEPERREEHAARFAWARQLIDSVDPEQLAALTDPRKALGAVRLFGGQVGGVATTLGRLLTLPEEAHTPLRGQLGHRKRVAWSAPLDVEEVKRVASTFDGTLNDALLLLLTDALRAVLTTQGVSSPPDLRCVVPVNLQPLGERTDDFGNGFGLIFLALPTSQDDPQDRIDILKARINRLKKSPEAFVTYAMLGAVGRAPAATQSQLARLFFKKATAVVTNVPGPIHPIQIAGKTIDDIIFWVPQSLDLGLGLSIFSYNGRVRVGVFSDVNLLPDPGALTDAFAEAFIALRDRCDAAHDPLTTPAL